MPLFLFQGASRSQVKLIMPAKEPDTDPLVGTKYEKIKFINSGSFGYVVLARNKETRAEVAIKFVEVSTEKDVKHRCGSALHPRRALVFCPQICAGTHEPLSPEPIPRLQPTRDYEPSAAPASPRRQADGGLPRRRLSRHRTCSTTDLRPLPSFLLPAAWCPHSYPP